MAAATKNNYEQDLVFTRKFPVEAQDAMEANQVLDEFIAQMEDYGLVLDEGYEFEDAPARTTSLSEPANSCANS